MTQFVLPADVRGYLNITAATRSYSEGNLGSNIRAASSFLQRATGRQFEVQTATKTFSTNGQTTVSIPDLRSTTSVALQGAAMTADSTYWLIPDRRNSGVYTSIQFRAFGQGSGSSYLSNPQWFDRNLDREWARYGYSTLPNDLVITGAWGWLTYPEELLHATKILAGFYTKRPDSVLSNVQVTPEGAILNFSGLPGEVQDFIKAWKTGAQVVSI